MRIESVVAELSKKFPDADPGPAGLWGFVNAGQVGDQPIEAWVAAWQDAEHETELDQSN